LHRLWRQWHLWLPRPRSMPRSFLPPSARHTCHLVISCLDSGKAPQPEQSQLHATLLHRRVRHRPMKGDFSLVSRAGVRPRLAGRAPVQLSGHRTRRSLPFRRWSGGLSGMAHLACPRPFPFPRQRASIQTPSHASTRRCSARSIEQSCSLSAPVCSPAAASAVRQPLRWQSAAASAPPPHIETPPSRGALWAP
jgi:hypothetical protein